MTRQIRGLAGWKSVLEGTLALGFRRNTFPAYHKVCSSNGLRYLYEQLRKRIAPDDFIWWHRGSEASESCLVRILAIVALLKPSTLIDLNRNQDLLDHESCEMEPNGKELSYIIHISDCCNSSTASNTRQNPQLSLRAILTKAKVLEVVYTFLTFRRVSLT